MSNDLAKIIEALETASEPTDELEFLHGRFLAVRFVLHGLLCVLSAERGSKSVLDTGLINCGFRFIPITDSDSFRSPVPTDSDQ